MFKRCLPFLLFLSLCLPLTVHAIAVGDTMPSFAGTDMDGKPFDLATIIGKQPVMLIFWASWCPNCTREVPKVNALYSKYGDQKMRFIGVNVGFNDSLKRARAFMDKTKMAYPVLFDKKGKVAKKYRVQGVPTVIVADINGRVVFKNYGVPDMTDEMLKKLSL